MRLSEAIKFAEGKAARGAAAQTTDALKELAARKETASKKTARPKPAPEQIRGSVDGAARGIGQYAVNGDKGKLAAAFLGAGRNFLPPDLAKLIPAAPVALDGNWSKFLSGDADGIKAALGALGSALPPELAQLLDKAAPVLTKNLENILKDGGLPDTSEMLSLENLAGIAAQFLPPWAGDALAVGKELLNNFPEDWSDFAGSLDNLIGRFLPPELQAAWGALQKAGGLKGLSALFDERESLQSPAGPWAARITDIVVCKGGSGPIKTGLSSVVIGGQSAARITDTAICIPNPVLDVLDHGEPTVIVGGQWATRKGDLTVHKGVITDGFPTVHIGRAVNLSGCGSCLESGASGGGTAATTGAGAGAGGVATISGSGMTAPLMQGCFGNAEGLGLGDALSNSLGDFAKDKFSGLFSDQVGELISNALGRSDESKSPTEVSPQPKIHHDDDDDFAVTEKTKK